MTALKWQNESNTTCGTSTFICSNQIFISSKDPMIEITALVRDWQLSFLLKRGEWACIAEWAGSLEKLLFLTLAGYSSSVQFCFLSYSLFRSFKTADEWND